MSSATTLFAAIVSDTSFYHRTYEFRTLLERPVLAPLNALRYNSSTSSLAAHGLHPRYQHVLVNLPLLLAPALPLLPYRPIEIIRNTRLLSAFSAIFILSVIPHQEPRFLIPIIPLILSSITLPSPTLSPRLFRLFAFTWVTFNLALGLVYGRYHQAGVVPAQLWLGENRISLGLTDGVSALWWKTYSPPVWLLNTPQEVLRTEDLMGTSAQEVEAALRNILGTCSWAGRTGTGEALLVLPRARLEPSIWRGEAPDSNGVLHHIRDMSWVRIWSEKNHVGLDDLDFAEDGIWGTLSKVVKKRGLDIWRIRRECSQ